MKSFFQIQNPSIFQGKFQKKQYFEGWYFKIVDFTKKTILAIIPGIALNSQESNSHAFIQILDGITAKYYYLTFPISDFSTKKNKFEIKIGKNYFSNKFIHIDVQSAVVQLKGTLKFENLNPIPFHGINPGIMGIFSYLPKMECYHGIVSMNHGILGNLEYNNNKISFAGGKGYIEKDWGDSFPKRWIWMQANHFEESERSFMLSIAQINYLGIQFTGFLCVLYDKGEFHRFATYNLSQFQIETITPEVCKIIVRSPKYLLYIQASKNKNPEISTGLMKAPIKGKMTAKCAETIKAQVKITFLKKKKIFYPDKNYELVFRDQSNYGGLEIMGKKTDFKFQTFF
nr:tocopherol cyclase family protein [Candidatus Prometheoarchaeum syntrophicum]QEE15841.1 hypothetical protein DSAG12_01668 [Candidatus Prometheoarchaeum syntrophicum]